MKLPNKHNALRFFTHAGIVIFLIIYLLILTLKVINKPMPFLSWDESIYLEVGEEMIEEQSLVPLWQGQPWFEKPPLVPLLYATVSKSIPVAPEVSTRLLSVLMTGVALALLYVFFLKAQKSALLALFVTIATAANPIILQRAQLINTDVFLLIGWLGYLLFFKRFKLSLFFLLVGVLSKSILGLYPLILVFMYETYQFIRTKNKEGFVLRLKELGTQLGIASLWFIGMALVYRSEFITTHFVEHLFRRYTKSLETHFGFASYYVDLFLIQYGNIVYVTLGSIVILTVLFFLKKLDPLKYFLSLALVPWFLFVIFARTKLEWYVYPAIPQILFLIIYPLTLLRKIPFIYYAVMMLLMINFISNNYELKRSIFVTTYSNYDDIYKLSIAVKNGCENLHLLADQNTRKDFVNLKANGLAISTTEVYGSHPSIIYYAQKKVDLYYQSQTFSNELQRSKPNSCWSFEEKDSELIKGYNNLKLIDKFGLHYLYKRV